VKIAEAYVELRLDGTKAKTDAKQAATGAAGVAKQALGLFSAALFVGGINKAIGAASRLEQAVGGTAAVFGEAAGQVDDFASTSAKALGISAAATRELTSQIGGLLKGFGFTQDEAAKMSMSLTTLGSDLAATFGGAPEEAVQALGAALRGETDPLERFGVSLNQTQINLKAVEMGLAESTAKVEPNAKAQAALALIYERTADAQGQSAREADTAAGAQVRAAAAAEDAAAKFGQQLLPIYARVQEVIGALADAFAALPGPVQLGVVALLGFVALAGPIKTVFSLFGDIGNRLRTAEGDFTRAGKAAALLGKALGALAASQAVVSVLNEMSDASGNLEEKLQGVIIATEGTSGELVAAFERLAGAEDKVLRLSNLWSDFGKEIKLAGTDSKRNIEDLDRAFGKLLDTGTDKAQAFIDALQTETDALDKNSGQYKDNISVIERWQEKIDLAAGAAGVLAGTVDKNTLAYLEYQAGMLDTIEGSDELAEATERVKKEYEDLTSAVDMLQGRLSDRDAYDDAIQAQNELIWANTVAWQTTESQKASEGEKAEALDASEAALRRSIDATLAYIETLGDIPPEMATKIAADIDDGNLAEVERRLRIWAANLRISTQIEARGGTGYGGTGPTQQRASGGPIPGPMGAPIPILAHGGEFMLSADVVQAIKQGRATSGLDGGTTANGGGGLSIGTLVVGDRRDLPDVNATLDRVLWESRFR